ncbi:hypothetical protein EDD86DRAFT_243613 [Gorgonomyces haynaldii]|nr:hypothetical protein EDD86DRAFT_243613 [Gorgonomyces haynaldii]
MLYELTDQFLNGSKEAHSKLLGLPKDDAWMDLYLILCQDALSDDLSSLDALLQLVPLEYQSEFKHRLKYLILDKIDQNHVDVFECHELFEEQRQHEIQSKILEQVDLPLQELLDSQEGHDRFVYDVKLRQLGSAIFDIIVEYPDSEDSLSDLQVCLEKTRDHGFVVEQLNAQLKSRLLHLGASTRDILTQYISTKICCARLSLSSTLILPQLHDYIASRQDAVGIILERMIANIDAQQKGEKPEYDNIDSLIDIFGDKTVFAKEYQQILSSSLLSRPDYVVDDHVRHFELLKQTFGEQHLANCQVMLKDVQDSRRTDNVVKSDWFHGLVVSDNYWPKLKKQQCTMPQQIQEQMTTFQEAFVSQRASRSIVWDASAGCVDLTLEIDSSVQQMKVLPCHANEMSLLQVCDQLQQDQETVEQWIHFWQDYDVLILTEDMVYTKQYAQDKVQKQKQRQKKLEKKETGHLLPMIKAMLTNIGACPLEQLHRTLGMLCRDPFPYTLTIDQLESFLGALLVEDKIDCNQVVADKFFPVTKDGKTFIYCETDYFKRLDLICAKCGQACSVCPTVFRQHDSYFEKDGQIYCGYHYSILYAAKCGGCGTAVLKNFVETSKESQPVQWHPCCYMIFKLWHVKLAQPQLQQQESQDPEYKVEWILRVLSNFEESAAECISEMLVYFSNGSYMEGAIHANKFIYHVYVLFGCIEDIDSTLGNYNGGSSIQKSKEPKQLVKKIIYFFSLLSGTQDVAARLAATKEMISLEQYYNVPDAVAKMLNALEAIKTTDGTLKHIPNTFVGKEDHCAICDKPVEEGCIKFESWLWHEHCFHCSVCQLSLAPDLPSAFVENGILYVSLLYMAWSRLCLMQMQDADTREHHEEYKRPIEHEEEDDEPEEQPTTSIARPAQNFNRNRYSKTQLTYLTDLTGLQLMVARQLAALALHPFVEKHYPLNKLLAIVDQPTKKTIWSRMLNVINAPKKKKEGMFGRPLELLVQEWGVDFDYSYGPGTVRVPWIIEQAINALNEQEGLFRKNGNIKRLKDVAEQIDQDPQQVILKNDNAIQVAALIKKFLREMPEPLLTFKLGELFITSQTSLAETEERGNKMTIRNLATVLAPNILWLKNANATPSDSMHAVQAVPALFLEKLLDQGEALPKAHLYQEYQRMKDKQAIYTARPSIEEGSILDIARE